jgi:hypothetical protein
MTPPPSSSAPTVPEMSADDARFYALKDHDDATTLSAWQTLEGEVRSGEDTPSSLPNVNLDHAVGEVIGLAPTFAKLRAPTLALFSAEQAAKTAKALDALPRLACAILYVLRQEARESADAPSVSGLNAEGFALRALGLRWCITLENLRQAARWHRQSDPQGPPRATARPPPTSKTCLTPCPRTAP